MPCSRNVPTRLVSLPRQRPLVGALFLALALSSLQVGCGESAANPTPVPSPSPSAGPALNMQLLANVPLSGLGASVTSVAGNWGYTTAGGRRFALTGTSNGTSIVEVTNPSSPRPVAFIAGPASQWREIKTFGEYIYVTTEARHGLDIISMRNPDRPELVNTWQRTFQSAHSLWIDQDRGLLFANGTNGRTGGLRILDIRTNPTDPEEVGVFNGFYVHDSYSRGTTLFAAAISDGFLGVLDVADTRRIREITRFNTGGRFTHNAWLTADGRHVFTTDERPGRPLEGYDITDVLAPRKVSEYIAAPGTIPHNVMIDGNRLLVSHYTEGVHLLDVSDPVRPRLLGSYDTYPGTATGFNGAWGAYIFPASNLILGSDISGGLFVLQYTGG